MEEIIGKMPCPNPECRCILRDILSVYFYGCEVSGSGNLTKNPSQINEKKDFISQSET